MAHMLRGGVGSEAIASAEAITTYFAKVKQTGHFTKYPPTRSRMKRKVLRGKDGAAARDVIKTFRRTTEGPMLVTTRMIAE